jgi:hypothetical protein
VKALWPVQVAAVARWEADAGVEALVGDRIYDGAAPGDTAMPYVVVGSKTAIPVRLFGSQGTEGTLTVHVFSEAAGDDEVLDVLSALVAALDTPLTIDDHTDARLKLEFAETLLENEGERTVRHLPARFRVVTLETA